MTFEINRSSPRQRIAISPAVAELAGINKTGKLAIHALDGIAVVTKAELSAMELAKIIWSLSDLAVSLTAHLMQECGKCEDCGYCPSFNIDEPIRLPAYLLEAAGLDRDCKLEAFVDENGVITVNEADYAYDLTDVPSDLLEMFRDCGICLHELEDRLMHDCIVYGNCKEKPKGDDATCAES